MATGKTNMRWARLLVDSLDLSGDTRQVGSIGTVYDQQDQTAYSDAVHNFTLGHPTFELSGYQAVWNNTAVTGSAVELAVLEEYIVSFCMGIKAAPALGDPAILQTVDQVSYTIDGSDAVLIGVEFGKSTTTLAYEKCFGDVLEFGTSRSDTWNGTGFLTNGDAATANGAIAHLHVVDVFTGAYTFKVQDSANNADWADLITFSADGQTLVAESGTVAGSVDKYLRFQGTAGAGTGAVWCTIARQ